MIRVLLSVLLITFSLVTAANANRFVEGQDYKRLSRPLFTEQNQQKQVTVFFWYACSHCFNFQKSFQKWKRPEGVSVVYVPAVYSPTTEFHARAYYSAMLVNGHDDVLHANLYGQIFSENKFFSKPVDFFPL